MLSLFGCGSVTPVNNNNINENQRLSPTYQNDVNNITLPPTITMAVTTDDSSDIGYISNSNPDQMVIYRLGEMIIKDDLETYELIYYKRAEQDYYLEIRVLGMVINYSLHTDFIPETVGIYSMYYNMGGECRVIDVNGDGNQDFFIDLGLSGHTVLRICYVYDESSASFVFVDGINELSMPKIYGGNIIENYHSQTGYTEIYNKYTITGNKICHIASLLYALNTFINDEGIEIPAGTYTEIELVNDEMIIINDCVTENDIDFGKWGIATY